MLIASGYDVIEAADGKEGLRVYQSGKVDLVITDIMMPEKDGMETISEMRWIDPKVRIIAISGNDRTGEQTYLGMAETLGADGVLAKPFELKGLLAKISDVLHD